MNSPQQNVVRYKVAHINKKGIDLVIVPLDRSFASKGAQEKAEVLSTFQRFANTAGLKGKAVLVWDSGDGKTGFLAEKDLHPHLRDVSLSYVYSSVNRELTVKGQMVSAGPISKPGDAGSASGPRAKDGVVVVNGDLGDCEVYLDSAFVGSIPTRIDTSAGIHLVEVKKAGYRDYRKQVQVTSGAELLIRPVLEKDETLMIPLSETMKLKAALDQSGKVAAFKRRHRSGLSSLVFTDIVGSTKLKQELGDNDAVSLMQQHHELVRSILREFPEGEEISTAGDSFFLIFDKPSDAVKFSLLVQNRLRKWGKESGRQLYDRIGIHVGEVFIEENAGSSKPKDLFGIQVDTSARVMSLAEGDQILMTRFAFDNARQVLKGQKIEGVGPISWINHGPYCLKGVEDELDICEVGEIGYAVLRPPPDSEKVHRAGSAGMKPPEEARPAEPHVIVSTKSSFQPVKKIFPSN